MDYKIFCSDDMPKLTTILVEAEEPTGPFGAKSVAEIAINGPAPCIANAIHDAIGVRLHSLPMTPEKILAALDPSSPNPFPHPGRRGTHKETLRQEERGVIGGEPRRAGGEAGR
ncbi:MAG: xanthine dehydrogenase family protein molybdopterin-binding subunit [Chloroflexi bacterium]|nr:xanthine dehydrogenase family protein molybdopterin-binding subunit [Chloroflexota bacterium]